MLINNSVMINNLVNNLNQIQEDMQHYTSELSSGHRVETPGDDPDATVSILNFQTALDQNQVYQNNAQDGLGWLGATQTALQSLGSILYNIRAVAVQAANGTMSPADLTAASQQVQAFLNQALQLGNQKYGEFYLFGGTSLGNGSTVLPFSQASAGAPFVYNGNANTAAGTIERQVSANDFIAVNLNGPGPDNGPGVITDALNALQKLAGDLTAGNTGNLQADLNQIDTASQEMTAATTWIGSQLDLMQQTKQTLTSQSVLLQGLQAKVQDADPAKVMMEFSNAQAALEATLKAGAEIIQPTLLDFLK